MDKSQRHRLRERIVELETKLLEMTEDRDLWQGAHNEDCPNLASISELEDQLETMRIKAEVHRTDAETSHDQLRLEWEAHRLKLIDLEHAAGLQEDSCQKLEEQVAQLQAAISQLGVENVRLGRQLADRIEASVWAENAKRWNGEVGE